MKWQQENIKYDWVTRVLTALFDDIRKKDKWASEAVRPFLYTRYSKQFIFRSKCLTAQDA